ncbi:MAG: hypothetical protein EXS67_02280 [Candidatus Margulisbacteria bacterium]|nr:hypothetical protein [Candidatus Margulisiibacteriota bacterium]
MKKNLPFLFLILFFFLGTLCPNICGAIESANQVHAHGCCSNQNAPDAPPCCDSHGSDISKVSSSHPIVLSDVAFVILGNIDLPKQSLAQKNPATIIQLSLLRPPDYLMCLNTLRLLC